MLIIISIIGVVLFLIGFLSGFTVYAVFLRIAVKNGKAFAIDSHGHWQPFDPYKGQLPKTMEVSGSFTGIKLTPEGIKILIDGVPVLEEHKDG